MNLADYIVLLLVATLVSFALHLMRSRKKNGSSCCGGGTGSGGPSGTCGSCGACGSYGMCSMHGKTGLTEKTEKSEKTGNIGKQKKEAAGETSGPCACEQDDNKPE